MTRISPALESHLAADVTTHCFCWVVRRQDGRVHGFTDHDRTLTIESIACEPLTGFNASEAKTSLGLAVDSAEVEGALSSLSITDSDIDRGAFDQAIVETWLVNWNAPEEGTMLRRSRIGAITRSGGRFIAELKGSAVDLDKIVGRRVTRRCDAQLGDKRCGYTAGVQQGVVKSTLSDRDIIVTGLQPPDTEWFDNGVIAWVGGGTNVVLGIEPYDGGTRLKLRDVQFPDVRGGDTFELRPGCDKSFTQCKGKFGNSVNFRGFPHLPGNDAAYNFADGRGNFDGGPLVP